MVEAERIDVYEDEDAGMGYYDIVLSNGARLLIEAEGLGYEDPMTLDIKVLPWETILSLLGCHGGGPQEVDA